VKISQKLISGFVGIALLIGAVGYVGIYYSRYIGEIFYHIESEDIPSLTSLIEIKAAARQAAIKAMEYSLRGEERDKIKTQEALSKMRNHLAQYLLSKKNEENNAKHLIAEKIERYSDVIISYITLSEGPSLPFVLKKEERLHLARKNLIDVLDREMNQSNNQIERILLNIRSEVRRASIRSIEYNLRGSDKDKIRVEEAVANINSLLQNLSMYVTKDTALYRDVTEQSQAYIEENINFIQTIDQRKVPVSEIYAREKEVHSIRQDLLSVLYSQIQKEENGLIAARINVRDSLAYSGKMLFFASLAVLFIAIVIGLLIARTISRPVRKLKVAANEIALGHLDTTIDVRSKDEIGDLAQAFTHMTKELSEKTEFMSLLVESLPVALYTCEADGDFSPTYFSASIFDLTGYTPEHFTSNASFWADNIHPEDMQRVILDRSAVFDNGRHEHEYRWKIADGSYKWFFDVLRLIKTSDGKINHIAGTLVDISYRKKLEEQLMQSQKLEAVGQLAGGVAHDFNNMLTAIIGYGYLLRSKIQEDASLRQTVDQILSVSERGAHLVQGLLAFSRKQVIDLKPVNLNDIIERIKKLLTRLIGEEIELRTHLSNDNLIIRADSGQIEQVLMNLAVNARDAMPDGGILTIETKPAHTEQEFMRFHRHEIPGPHALISVIDSGMGMDDATKEKIFEPFFTTKEVGKGTGLGLATVYGIIEQHSGHINVSSETGKGTTFSIYLPLIQEEVEDTKGAEEPHSIHGKEIILLAEDQKEVRKSMKCILEEFGFTVIEAVDGQDAVDKFIMYKDKIQFLILDVIMPRKNGREAFEEIKNVRPHMKALFISGYTADIIERKGILEKGLDFIYKPISPDDLTKKLKELIGK